jgi:isopenicillin-N N-acyltransferase-like protein
MGTPKPCRLIELRGSPIERGRQYGRNAAAEIRIGISHYLSQVRQLDLSDAALHRIVSRYLPTIVAFDPRYVEEMRGIADGADVELAHIVMLNARTEVLKLATDPERWRQLFHEDEPEGCTSIVVEPEASAEGRLIHAHNWDWKVESAEASVILRIVDGDTPDILTFTEAGALGRFGFNSVGIAISANYLESDRDYTQIGVPLALIRRKVLEQSHLADAIRCIYATSKSASNNIAISHSGGGMAFDFECAPDETFEVEPQDGLLVHANHWRSAVALTRLRERGLTSMPDSLYRERRVRKLLTRKIGRLMPADIKSALLDNWDTPWSICRPPRTSTLNNLSATVCTLVMQPSIGLVEISMLPAINPGFTTYSLDVSPASRSCTEQQGDNGV